LFTAKSPDRFDEGLLGKKDGKLAETVTESRQSRKVKGKEGREKNPRAANRLLERAKKGTAVSQRSKFGTSKKSRGRGFAQVGR